MSTWLDQLPSNERARIRARLRSPEAYEKLREKVKGPEDMEQEMEKNEALAELSFALETEPVVKDALKTQIEKDIAEQGVEAVFGEVSPDRIYLLEQGKFEIDVDASADSAQEQLVVIPEGTVNEKIPLTQNMSEKYVRQFVSED